MTVEFEIVDAPTPEKIVIDCPYNCWRKHRATVLSIDSKGNMVVQYDDRSYTETIGANASEKTLSH